MVVMLCSTIFQNEFTLRNIEITIVWHILDIRKVGSSFPLEKRFALYAKAVSVLFKVVNKPILAYLSYWLQWKTWIEDIKQLSEDFEK